MYLLKFLIYFILPLASFYFINFFINWHTGPKLLQPGVTEHAFFLKELGDAQAIRRRVLDNLEAASLPNVTDAERRRLLHFVIVGGGPTGIEFAGELDTLRDRELVRWYNFIFCFKVWSAL